MAVFITQSTEQDGDLTITERIEVRPWWVGGQKGQDFVIGSGSNFGANNNILIEIIYSVNDVQLFYTRNFISHYVSGEFSLTELQANLDAFIAGERDGFGFGDMLPETFVIFRRDKNTYSNGDQEQTYISYCLRIGADIGAGIGHSSPGMRMIKIEVDVDTPEDGFAFMRQLVCEIADLHQAKHPDPAVIPAGTSDWTFARLVNQKAYDRISEDYEEHYFSEPLLTEAFDAWLRNIPHGGHILDAGCGHGKPVIARLLEEGYRVSGTDLSPKMLERARQNFPDVHFYNQLASEMMFEREFDGACSLSSLLYLDPIDLSHSLYRLYRALKPNGYLFLHAYDLHPSYRGCPYHVDIDQWMWGWTYGIDEVVQMLQEHGYFKVLTAQDVTSEQEKQERIEHWFTAAMERYDTYRKDYPDATFEEPDRNKPPRLSYGYAIVAQAQIK